MPSPSPFEILGVTPRDNARAIRRAWRRLVKAHHPDRNPQDRAGAMRRLIAVNAAYDKLRNHAPLRRPATPDARTEQPCPGAQCKARSARSRPAATPQDPVSQSEPRSGPRKDTVRGASPALRAALAGFGLAAAFTARPTPRSARIA